MMLLSPQLEAFMAVVKYKTVNAAAEALFITQTAATQRIRALEQRLKVTLFIRSRKGMALTQEGEALLHYCQAASMLEGHCLAKMKGVEETSIIRTSISAPSSIMRSRVIPACYTVTQHYPHIRFSLIINDLENRHLSLRAGEVDLTVLSPEHMAREMEHKSLNPEKYLLVIPKAWADRPLKDILTEECIIDFEETDQMTFDYLKKFGGFKHIRSERHYINNTEDLVELVALGMGYTVLTEEFYELYAKHRPIEVVQPDRQLNVPINLCWYNRPEMPAYFKMLIDLIE